jgi:hypothetical protein
MQNTTTAGKKMTQQLTAPTILISLMDQKESSNDSFETALNAAIEEVLTPLGENVKQATYSYVENRHKIRKEQIPSRIEDFTWAIESIFGDASRLIEVKIMEKLQDKTQGFVYKSNCEEIFFVEYLAALQRYLG